MRQRPRLVIVTPTVHGFGASLLAYALAPALGARRDILRLSHDPLSPLLRNYLRYTKTGSIAPVNPPRDVTYQTHGAPSQAIGPELERAESLGIDTILWDLSGPGIRAGANRDDWAALLSALPDRGEATLVVTAGLTQWAQRHLGVLAGLFPRTLVARNLLLGEPRRAASFPTVDLPATTPEALEAIDSIPEPLDELAVRPNLQAMQRARLGALLDAGRRIAAALTPQGEPA
jgi:hypothetical protein